MKDKEDTRVRPMWPWSTYKHYPIPMQHCPD